MGNLCKKEQNANCFDQSSIYFEPRSGIYIKENIIDKYLFNRQQSLLMPSVSRLIIKEELGKETEIQKIRESGHKNSRFTQCTSNQNLGESSINHNTIQLINVSSERYLHSHRIRHQNSRLNEVLCCQDCHNEYDTWVFENINENVVKLYHPLTKYYLKAQKRSNNGQIEVGGSDEGDEWSIEKISDNIKIKHQNTGYYLQTHVNQCNLEGQLKVSLQQIDCGKPNDNQTLWKIIEI
ncbi:unnamed protein product (macronuclear) [Paramecium tetraurelia]|uniref:MIR domain-containing protein n=1 Tax=Paramecium tetraurelia TaxID=5888 RepID=A0CJS1_PARTE|nr:uncharacterized protein GSPATT00000750001 [Paramecium tetraurelia]CAK71038.1 unnamed protein product [Paramecium tetraurelia]|eukprot:XP_001438435.1 hypothetical protein (macronuclear) [Paramecium tetraurelia strain d4-2]